MTSPGAVVNEIIERLNAFTYINEMAQESLIYYLIYRTRGQYSHPNKPATVLRLMVKKE